MVKRQIKCWELESGSEYKAKSIWLDRNDFFISFLNPDSDFYHEPLPVTYSSNHSRKNIQIRVEGQIFISICMGEKPVEKPFEHIVEISDRYDQRSRKKSYSDSGPATKAFTPPPLRA